MAPKICTILPIVVKEGQSECRDLYDFTKSFLKEMAFNTTI